LVLLHKSVCIAPLHQLLRSRCGELIEASADFKIILFSTLFRVFSKGAT